MSDVEMTEEKYEYPYLYHPDLPGAIIIHNERTFRAAKIFWDDIEEIWNWRMQNKKFLTSQLPGIYTVASEEGGGG